MVETMDREILVLLLAHKSEPGSEKFNVFSRLAFLSSQKECLIFIEVWREKKVTYSQEPSTTSHERDKHGA